MTDPSPVILRTDPKLGGVAFSRATGLIYAIASDWVASTRRWLEDELEKIPEEIQLALGAGWRTPISEVRFSDPHLLPSETSFEHVSTPTHPVLVNWFITGRCPLACQYCYAEDLMRREEWEPGGDDIRRYAKNILALRPTAVVLTGGDPLFGGNLGYALDALQGQVGVTIDTSAYTLNARHLELLKAHRVPVRVSLDAERPSQHDRQRPVHSKYPALSDRNPSTHQQAVDAINTLLDADLPVTVQTVATVNNLTELMGLGEKLVRWGVHAWRVFRVAPSEARLTNYRVLVGEQYKSGKTRRREGSGDPFEYHFSQLISKFGSGQIPGFSLQIARNQIPNAVILVAPNGQFVTESNVETKKIVIDETNPESPSLEALAKAVDLTAHAARYLNLTTRRAASKGGG